MCSLEKIDKRIHKDMSSEFSNFLGFSEQITGTDYNALLKLMVYTLLVVYINKIQK